MLKVGGSSYTNGIRFTSNNYSINFETYPNETKMFLRKKDKKISKVLTFMLKIPLIRGIAQQLDNFKPLLPVYLLDFIFNIHIINTGSEYIHLFPLSGVITYATILCVAMLYFITKVVKNLKFTRQYHGAEHKVIFTNNENKLITLENCRNAPRISDNCGTMYVVLFFFTFVVVDLTISFFGIRNWFCLRIIFTHIITYEFFLLDRNVPVIRWLFKLGYWFQEKFFTLEPSDLQLNQAIEAFKLLEKAENGEIPDNELKQLLKSGKNANFFTRLF